MELLSKRNYLDKMLGCWLGKAIGGTLGATFEARRGVFDLDFYPTPLEDGMLPNDDLDLQLVWLNAAERYKTELTAEKLTDYWMLGVLPNWAEYGVGKANMRLGLNAPASGKYHNRFKDSNGAWIRSELWACLAPGHPEIAVKYAMEDACTDHADEGVYAEVFTAALESAAFVESDKYKLIDIALSYIPADCDCAGAVRKIVELYQSGIDWKETRIRLLNAYPDSFGGQLGEIDPAVPNGNWGYDAPANLALTLIGWLYAGDDFGRALCITAGCGEDDDCTTGALGAILGILMGAEGIPEKWKAPVGNEIKTICCNTFPQSIRIPRTMNELVARVMNLTPAFLGDFVDLCGHENGMFRVFSGDELFCRAENLMDSANGWEWRTFREEITHGYVYRGSSPLMDVKITARDGIDFVTGAELGFDIQIDNTTGLGGICGMPLYADFRWLLPEGMHLVGGSSYTVFANQKHCANGRAKHTVTLAVDEMRNGTETLICEVSVRGMASRIYIPVTLICAR